MPKKKSSFNIAVIGAGAIGIDHIRSFQTHPAAHVVALAEVSPERGQEAVDTYGIPTLVTDYQELLKRDDIDVVSIALPNFLHASVGLEALKAGKHLMVDKPMATNARDAAKLITEAKKRRLKLMVGQNMRFSPEVQTARKLITDGKLGDVYHAKTAWTRRSGIPRIGSWFTQKQFAGGGCTYDIGVHALDRALFLMGEFDAAAVSGQTYSQLGPRGRGEGNWGKGEIDKKAKFDVDDLSVALIKLKSGRTVLLEASWAAHLPQHDFFTSQVFGTDAGVMLNPLRLIRPGKQGYITEEIAATTPLANENRMVHFIDTLLGKAEPYVKPAESLAVQKILDAIYKSAATGREVRIK
ncbi:Gfo/Idh/MocA family protein [Synoicihabitans lomoniglobus]|uniref:Gfo/Idh/MocA family oxidoreductase n=1 Tax=Synoicihabitans lomoniglobus TaxID=2909285 RepID=A0AAE9ZVE2_9BACT|nr:Gfo/Idh/MocA family oxidoreductase [Opitutaceae bacterium LMO-M01]WED65760.1 Gfo/Idh/MocA family oxidoreductase [Opitutaceae bacterium LMO-M01]